MPVPLRQMLLPTFLGAVLLLSGCGAEEATAPDPAEESTTGAASSGLCEVVQPVLNERYGLSVQDEVTEGEVRTCRLASEDGATTLDVEVHDVPDGDLAAALRSTCAELGLVEDSPGKRCSSPTDPGVGVDQVLAATLLERSAVLVATLRSEDEAVALTAPAELAAVEFALAAP